MERAHPKGVGQEQAEVPEWVGQGGEEGVVPEQVQAQQGSVFVPNAERLHPMRLEFPALLSNVPNVA